MICYLGYSKRVYYSSSKFGHIYNLRSMSISASESASASPPGDNKTEIIEGSASMLYDKSEAVFYNKVQVMNRDISIQVISHFSRVRALERAAARAKKTANASLKGDAIPFHDSFLDDSIHILDALAATGLRSIRYLKEIPLARHVTINDLDANGTANCLIFT